MSREEAERADDAIRRGDQSQSQSPLYYVRVLNLGGDLLCTLEDCGDVPIAKLKQLIEDKTGWDPELTVLLHAKHGELADEKTLGGIAVEQTTEVHAQLLRRVVCAERLNINAAKITDDELNALCDLLAADPPDILDLSGCSQIGRSLSHLPLLPTLSVLCMSGCQSISGDLVLTCLQAMEGLTVRCLFFHSPSTF